MEKQKYTSDFEELDESELENTLNEFLKDTEEVSKDKKWNFATISGMVFIVFAILYALNSFLGVNVSPDIIRYAEGMPIIGMILVLLVGFGLIASNRSGKKSKKKKQKKKSSAKAKSFKSNEKTDAENPKVDAYGYKKSKTLYRSRNNAKVFGVCAGLARYFGIDATFVRIVFIVGAIYYSAGFWLYIALAYFLDKEPKEE